MPLSDDAANGELPPQSGMAPVQLEYLPLPQLDVSLEGVQIQGKNWVLLTYKDIGGEKACWFDMKDAKTLMNGIKNILINIPAEPKTLLVPEGAQQNIIIPRSNGG